MVDGSSLLLDLDGVVVESVQRLADGSRLVVSRRSCGRPRRIWRR